MSTIYYASLNANSFPVAFYNTDIYPPQSNGALNSNIPANCTIISETQWTECINNSGLRQIVNGKVVTYTPPVTNTISVPTQVTNYQARAALISAGLFTKADSAIRSANDALTIAAWDYANIFYRDSPFVNSIGQALQITSFEIDNLFIAASNIN